MADSKITALTAISTVDPAADPLVIVDVSDTSMAASGTTKKITSNQILGAGGTATLASATITGAATVGTTLGVTGVSTFAAGTAALPALTTTGDTNTGIFYPAADTFAVTTGGTERYRVDSSGNVGIGTSSPNISASSKALTIAGTFTRSRLELQNTAGNTDGNVCGTISFFNGSNAVGYITGASNSGSATAGYIDFASSGGSMRLDSSGNVGIGVTPSAGAGCLQLVSGINFPATQVASANANTLDDYEEGTWTATLKGSVSDPTTPVTVTGAYTKVGRLVTVTANFSNVNTTGASGNVTISGLPFSGAASSAGSAITFDLFTTSTTLACWNTGTNVAFYVSGGFIPATHSAGASRSLNITISYYV